MGNINQRLNGMNPLAYLGDNATQPPQFVIYGRAPTTNDSQNFYLGDEWLDKTTEDVYKLVSLDAGVAIWALISSGATGTLTELTGDIGGPVFPVAGNINIVGDGTSVEVSGNPATHTLTISSIADVTQYDCDSGSAVPAAGILNVEGIDNIATTGSGSTISISVAGTTNHAVQVGDAGGALNSLAVGTTGQVLTGVTGSDPVWATPTFFSSVVTQTFIVNGTYTPTSGMKYCIAEVVGGGGGGGGSSTCDATQMSAASGGAAGGYSRKSFPAATIGVSQVVTVGAAGVAGLAENNAGGTGGTSSLGSLISATGGTGGGGSGADTGAGNNGSVGGVGSGGSLNNSGAPGGAGNAVAVAGAGNANSGFGGSSIYGGGAPGLSARDNTHTSVGVNAGNYGSGGSGGVTGISSSGQAGGTGSAGIVIITEYI